MSIDVGSIVEGKVTGITHFGAFVELSNGKTGLIHISEVADAYVRH
jgi:S1 RNA binding domain protein